MNLVDSILCLVVCERNGKHWRRKERDKLCRKDRFWIVFLSDEHFALFPFPLENSRQANDWISIGSRLDLEWDLDPNLFVSLLDGNVSCENSISTVSKD
jgi:hypothetical protein